MIVLDGVDIRAEFVRLGVCALGLEQAQSERSFFLPDALWCGW